MSSTEGFLDLLYLGTFVTLSPAFDGRFYHGQKPASAFLEEIAHAIAHFHSLLQIFSLRYIILLEGEPVAHSYVADRMLAEFAAASVAFAKDVEDCYVQVPCAGEGKEVIPTSVLEAHVKEILQESHQNTLPYYLRCLQRRHKQFLWSGPKIQILQRSEDLVATLRLMSMGELLDHPAQNIYETNPDPPAGPPPATNVQADGPLVDGDGHSDFAEEQPRKRKRRS